MSKINSHESNHSHIYTQTAPVTTGRTIRWANHYDLVVKLLTFGREATIRNETIRLAAIPDGASVLDVGCGTGTLTLLAKAQAGEQGMVYGIDASPEMIDVARQKAFDQHQDVNFQIGLIEELPFSDSTFDVILSSMMFHHLPPNLKTRGLAEIYRVLKPGGRLLIVDMKRPTTRIQRWTLVALVHHEATRDVRDLLPLMEQIGYVNTESGGTSWSILGFVQSSRLS